jgi:hypothetical protein
MDEKVKENKMRRQLDRMGYCLIKSRIRDERAIGYGGYMIANKWTNAVEAGHSPYAYCLTIDDVESFIGDGKPNFPKGSRS